MKTWVLDAGVAAKWHLAGEPLADEAIGMLQQFQTGDIEFLVPDLFLPGFGNVLWKAAGQARISSADAERAIGSLAADILATAPSQPPLGNAFALAHRCDRSVYDCIYVAPAIDHGHELLTAGERMVNAFGLRYPVRWLGSLVR